MNKRVKFILSIIGLAAVIVPAVLLIVSASRTSEVPAPVQDDRTIDTQNIQEATSKKLLPSPVASTSSALPSSQESTSSQNFLPQ